MDIDNLKGSWALVTGASSGIGRAFAIRLAEAGLNLCLVARRAALLDTLARDLEARHGVRVLCTAKDLLRLDGALPAIDGLLDREGARIRLLCNSAAFGRWGKFEQESSAVYADMIALNTTVVVSLCHHFLPHLTSFPSSAIINISSPAAFQPVPYMAVYAATKAFVHSFSQALYGEWKERGVLVQTLVPGPTETEFDRIAGAYGDALKQKGTPEEVVRSALTHLKSDAPVAIAARGTFQQRFLVPLLPAKVVINSVERMFRPPADP
jgi:short-subunit dehydrogenase